jgi:hypothetical protein
VAFAFAAPRVRSAVDGQNTDSDDDDEAAAGCNVIRVGAATPSVPVDTAATGSSGTWVCTRNVRAPVEVPLVFSVNVGAARNVSVPVEVADAVASGTTGSVVTARVGVDVAADAPNAITVFAVSASVADVAAAAVPSGTGIGAVSARLALACAAAAPNGITPGPAVTASVAVEDAADA